MSQVAITGNTFPVKDQIKALGGRWNADEKCWMVPAAKADEARKLVAGAPKQPFSGRPYQSSYRRPKSGDCSCYQCRRGSESQCIYG